MSDGQRFPGFSRPRYTPCPDQLFDELLPELSLVELRVLLYIIRRTFGFKKDSDAISVTQMESGITTRDGRVLDRGTGLSTAGVRKGLRGLLERGVIEAFENRDENGASLPTTYALRFKEEGVYSRTPSPDTGVHPQGAQVDTHNTTVLQDTEEQEDFDFEFETHVLDFAREFRDKSPRSSVTRVRRLFEQSGCSPETFRALLYEARDRTRKATNVKARAPYFLSTLEDLVREATS